MEAQENTTNPEGETTADALMTARLASVCEKKLKADVRRVMKVLDRNESWLVRAAVREYVERHDADHGKVSQDSLTS